MRSSLFAPAVIPRLISTQQPRNPATPQPSDQRSAPAPSDPRILLLPMSFARRYLTRLLVPPAVVTLPLAFFFLTQVIQLTRQTGLMLAILLIVLYAGGAVAFWWLLRKPVDAVEEAVESHGDASVAMSHCLDRTKFMAVVLWLLGGLVFASLATLLIMRSGLGFGYFSVAALIAAFPSIAWSYAAGKHLLIAYTVDVPQ